MRKLKVAAAIIAAASLSGCYTLKYDTADYPDARVAMEDTKNTRVVRHFKREDKAVWMLAGLVPVSIPRFSKVVHEEAGDRVVKNLRIQSEMSVSDGVIALGGSMLLGLIVSVAAPGNAAAAGVANGLAFFIIPQLRTVTIEGDIVEPVK